MKAARISKYGGVGVVKVVDVERPLVGDGQVMVEVHASSINPFDTAIRSGYMKEMIPLELPITLGGDIAGTIAEVGKGVTSVAVGDAIYGQANVVAGNSGAFAEFAVTSVGQVAAAPKGLSFDQAASLPLVGVSAWQGLVAHIGLKSGQKVFIHGGAGGIGTIAIQIAKHLGSYVATTATGAGINYVEELGANEVIDYKTQKFAEQLRDYDAVFELAGGKDFDETLSVLKPGGVAVSMIASANENKVKQLSITAIRQQTEVTTQALDALRELVELGVVTPHIEKIFRLDEITQAFELRETGSTRGKVVIEIKQ